MEALLTMVDKISWNSIIQTGVRVFFILLVAWVSMHFLQRITQKLEQALLKNESEKYELGGESYKRVETIVRLLRQGLLMVLWLTAGLIVLKEFGVEIAPIIASAGIVGLAVGFGAQNLVRDIIAGFFMILENQIRVGDVVSINSVGGLVEEINFRTIVLRDLKGTVHIFPAGTITTLSNMTKQWSAYVFEISVAYKQNTDTVVAIIEQVGAEMMADSKFGKLILEKPEIFGVDAFTDSAVIIKGRIKTKPISQWEVGREFLRRIKMTFDAQGIEIPFPQRVVHVEQGQQFSNSSL